jgi:hypothetical protein
MAYGFGIFIDYHIDGDAQGGEFKKARAASDNIYVFQYNGPEESLSGSVDSGSKESLSEFVDIGVDLIDALARQQKNTGMDARDIRPALIRAYYLHSSLAGEIN